MKYICLGYIEEKKWETMSESERNAMIEEERSLCWRGSAPERPERHYPAMEERQGVNH